MASPCSQLVFLLWIAASALLVTAAGPLPRILPWLERYAEDCASAQAMLNRRLICSTASNDTLQVNRIPNPFPVPHTSLSIDFLNGEDPSLPLAMADFRLCIVVAQERIGEFVQRFGDGPIPSGHGKTLVQWRFGNTWIRVEAPLRPVLTRVTWSQAIAVLAALRMRMDQGGYRERWGEIIDIEVPPVVLARIEARKFVPRL